MGGAEAGAEEGDGGAEAGDLRALLVVRRFERVVGVAVGACGWGGAWGADRVLGVRGAAAGMVDGVGGRT